MRLHYMQQNKAGFQRPDTFEQYLNVVLEFTKHDSQVSDLIRLLWDHPVFYVTSMVFMLILKLI